jgi:hypothetical protein
LMALVAARRARWSPEGGGQGLGEEGAESGKAVRNAAKRGAADGPRVMVELWRGACAASCEASRGPRAGGGGDSFSMRRWETGLRRVEPVNETKLYALVIYARYAPLPTFANDSGLRVSGFYRNACMDSGVQFIALYILPNCLVFGAPPPRSSAVSVPLFVQLFVVRHSNPKP